VGDDPLIDEAVRQLEAYFQGVVPACFSIPILYSGSAFQRRVWDALQAIPAGTSLSYGALAAQLRSSARAVAGACRTNPLPLLVPCHRIIGKHGMGGYCGETDGPWLDVKRWLLRHEQSFAAP
jgi:methylated-DNA-[protein]-cysteine S-methyltransferase